VFIKESSYKLLNTAAVAGWKV